MKIPLPKRIVVTVKGWRLVIWVRALLERREKPKPSVPAVDTDPDGGWVEDV